MNYSPETLRWIAQRNIENIVHFYRPELVELESTGETPKQWTSNEFKNIQRCGIITKKNKSPGTPWKLTPLARKILEELEASPNGGTKDKRTNKF